MYRNTVEWTGATLLTDKHTHYWRLMSNAAANCWENKECGNTEVKMGYCAKAEGAIINKKTGEKERAIILKLLIPVSADRF